MQIGMNIASCPYCPSKAKALAASSQNLESNSAGNCHGCADSVVFSPAAAEIMKGGCCGG